MNIVVVYIYPMTGEQQHDDYALRFIKSYNANPTWVEHRVVVICNGDLRRRRPAACSGRAGT